MQRGVTGSFPTSQGEGERHALPCVSFSSETVTAEGRAESLGFPVTLYGTYCSSRVNSDLWPQGQNLPERNPEGWVDARFSAVEGSFLCQALLENHWENVKVDQEVGKGG